MLRSVLTKLESAFGDIPALRAADTSAVITLAEGKLTSSALTSLLRHEALCVLVKGFLPPSVAEAGAEELVARAERGEARDWMISTSGGLETSDVQTIGTPPNMLYTGNHNPHKGFGVDDDDDYDDENDDASPSSASNRPLDEATMTPSFTSLILSSLSACHPPGVKTSPSIPPLFPRLMPGPTRWRSGYVHCDSLEPLSPSSGTFSANLYLRQPPPSSSWSGARSAAGRLYVWPLRYTRPQFYLNSPTLSELASSSAEGQARLRGGLGEPVEVEVEAGDLALICVQRPHAVGGFREGWRVSLQGFLEYEEGKPMVFS